MIVIRDAFQADKRLQLADWRIRPLTDELMHYARADTHSLLYIYDCLRVHFSKTLNTMSTSVNSRNAGSSF